VSMQVRALVIGSLVDRMAGLPLGQQADFAGFLAPARNGRGAIFNIIEVLV